MQHWILRCKHCQKEYTYCTYGNGPEYGTEEGCSTDYCAECQKAIDDALNKIPVKFRAQRLEINEPETLLILAKIKEEDDKKDYLRTIKVSMTGDYDNIDMYTHNWKTYYIAYNDNTPEDKHLFVEMTYDILNNQLTNDYWKAQKGEDSYMHGRSMARQLLKSQVKPMNMTPPTGKMLPMMDFGWNVITK